MRISAVDWTHEFLKRYVKEGDVCIDATMGNGAIRFSLPDWSEKMEKYMDSTFRKSHWNIRAKS